MDRIVTSTTVVHGETRIIAGNRKTTLASHTFDAFSVRGGGSVIKLNKFNFTTLALHTFVYSISWNKLFYLLFAYQRLHLQT